MANILVTKKEAVKQMALVLALPFLVVLLYGIFARAYLTSIAETDSEVAEIFAQVQSE